MSWESVRAAHGRYLRATVYRQASSPRPHRLHRPHHAHIKFKPPHCFHGGQSFSAGLRLLLDLKEAAHGCCLRLRR